MIKKYTTEKKTIWKIKKYQETPLNRIVDKKKIKSLFLNVNASIYDEKINHSNSKRKNWVKHKSIFFLILLH